MSDVFDILMRIGVTDEITHVLRDISGGLEGLAHQAESLGTSFSGLVSHVGMLGTALMGLAGAGAVGMDALAKHGGEYLDILKRMEIQGYSVADMQKAQSAAWETHLAVPTTSLTKNLELFNKLKDLTGSFDVAQSLTAPLAKLQAMADILGKGETTDVMKLFAMLKGYGMTPEAAVNYIGRESQLWAGGNVTPAQSAMNQKALGELGADMTRSFRENIVPVLEKELPTGARLNWARGLSSVFEEMMKSDKHGVPQGLPHIRQFLAPGQEWRGLTNDPYAFAQALAKGLEAHGMTPAQLRIAGERTGPERQTVVEMLRALGITNPAAQEAYRMMITQGKTAMGGASPFEQGKPAWDWLKAVDELMGDFGPARAGMFTAVHDFLTQIGADVAKFEIPKMLGITKAFNEWTAAWMGVPEADRAAWVGIGAEVLLVVGSLGALATALWALRGAAILFTPGAAALLGLVGVGAVIADMAAHWDKNKSFLENFGGTFARFVNTLTEQVLKLLHFVGLTEATAGGTRNNLTDYGRLHPDFGGLGPRAMTDARMRTILGPEAGFAGPGGNQILAGIPRMLRDGSVKKPWSPWDLLPSGLPPGIGMRAPTGAIGPIFPFGNFGPRAPSFNERFWPGGGSTPGPASFNDRFSAISGMGGGDRQRSVTVATNLNIDGRTLASMVSEHVVDMMSGAGSAAAGMVGPGTSQYSPG